MSPKKDNRGTQCSCSYPKQMHSKQELHQAAPAQQFGPLTHEGEATPAGQGLDVQLSQGP